MTDDRTLQLADGSLPSARSITAQLKEQLNAAVLAERARRGTVAMPEDTWVMQRSLARVIDLAGEYKRAFATVERETKAIAEEELITAVGEQDGIPNQNMTIPDPDGDVLISRWTENTHTYDQDALITAVAYEVLEAMDVHNVLLGSVLGDTYDGSMLTGEAETAFHVSLDNFLAGVLTMALTRLTELGRFEPQVTKVKAFTSDLGRTPGSDGIVASVTSSYRKTTQYRGVKVERKMGRK